MVLCTLGGSFPAQINLRNLDRRSLKKLGDPNWKGLPQVQEPWHHIHLYNICPPKPCKNVLIPSLKVKFKLVSPSGHN